MNETEVRPKQGFFKVDNFRFENEKVEHWVNLGNVLNTEYDFEIRKTGITPLNQNEALLRFDFRLELLPDIGKITFNGDCILYSSLLKTCIMILKAKEDSLIQKKNKAFMTYLNDQLRKNCFEYAKELGEKEGMHFDKWDLFLHELGLDQITFKKGKEQVLQLKKDKRVLKVDPHDIKNFGGFKKFIYFNEQVIPGPNSGKKYNNAEFYVKGDLNEPKILSKMSLLVPYHFVMNITPDVGHIEFDGQFIFDSFKKEIGYLLNNKFDNLKVVLQNVIAKAGIRHAEKISKKYRIGFSSEVIFKKLGLK
ncbi:MAG: hypothetical protein ACFFDH_13790 [Promethearchaeota archaeon]